MILMTKIYDVKSFEVHLASRGFADNSIKSFASDIRQFIDSELDPEGYLEDLKRKGYKNSTLMRKRASLINYYKFNGCSGSTQECKEREWKYNSDATDDKLHER